ncbi:MAG TPA: class I SAM-dependent methyltransferase [Xanthobacteraceae bacterium]
MTMTMPLAPTAEREAACYANKFRQRRLQRLLTIVDEIIAVRGTCRILDVGGWTGYWQFLEPLWRDRPIHITMVNLVHVPVPDERFSSLTGDARDLSNFDDLSFDLVHSNSVIEHVGLWRDQRKMAQEVRRLAARYFVQTPNYWFPLEPHLRTPFIHWLPEPWRAEIVKRRACGYHPRAQSYDEARNILDDARLLDAPAMSALFPDAVIERERFAGLTKSLIAIR